MTFRTTIVRGRLTAPVACFLFATVLPLSAVAEQGIPAGGGAIITAGQPLSVRATPGWDAEVSYDIADGSYVTVWDAAQTAPDGSLWYPVDGGFVPVDAVTSTAPLDGGFALYQDAAPQAVTEEWVDPATTELAQEAPAEGWVDPATGQWVEAAAAEYVAPVAQEAWVDPAAQTAVAAAPVSQGWVDPETGQWVEPAPVQEGWVDPNTGQWVEPAAADTGWVDPNTGEWTQLAAVAPATSEEWVDPNAASLVKSAPAEEWVEPAAAETVSTSGSEGWGEPIATAYISGSNGDGAVCRAGAERSTSKLAVLGEGEQVEVRGEAVGEWQPVNCAGIGGYVHTSLISWDPLAPAADAAFVEEEQRRGKNRNNGNSGNAGVDGTASASGSGNQMANFAMQYVGYPYAYAGEGPYAFDCSGFTKFVAQNVLGMDITHDMFQQIGMGQSVGMNELQPGDLVFFANTFRPGLSHAGIYIGGGQFVHAENESTGVKVSDLNSDYYGSRWAGGTRLA
ncbi:MAG: C40 family peptidase [Chloroflexia bacterium]|nr:C40 family peptidase [Chloroflexia bacterium]